MTSSKVTAFTVALLVLGSTAPAWSLTGEDVLDRMSKDERGGYLAGSIEMAAFLSAMQGNNKRADCIMDWYYKQDGVEKLVAALSGYKDRQALPVVHVIIKKACGEYTPATLPTCNAKLPSRIRSGCVRKGQDAKDGASIATTPIAASPARAWSGPASGRSCGTRRRANSR
jgi:hypothetical protein